MSLKEDIELIITATNTTTRQKLNNFSFEIKQKIEQVENPYDEWVDDVFPRHPQVWIAFEEARQAILKELGE